MVSVLLLGAFTALTYWLNAQVQPGAAKFDGSGRHDTDLYIENFKAVSLDEEGRVRQSIKAKGRAPPTTTRRSSNRR